MASRLLARRQQNKKATTLVSKQSLEQAIQEGNALVDQFMNTDAHDARLDQLEPALSFLTGVLKKSPVDMQQEGASNLEDYLDDAIMPEFAEKIKQDVDMISKMKNAGNQTTVEQPVMASGSDNWVSDRDNEGKVEAEPAEVPRLAAKSSKVTSCSWCPTPSKPDSKFHPNGQVEHNDKPKKTAAPAAVPPAAPKPSADITQLSSDTLAKMQKALAGSEDLMNDKAAQAFIAAIAQELMNRPVETEAEEPAQQQMPIAAALIGGLHLAEYDEDEDMEEENIKKASQGGSFVNDGETGSVVEDGGRTPEIGKAHKELEDNTGIKRPATELVTKFAGDMTTGKAVKMTETLSDDLKKLYLEAKKVTEVLDTRPVREAVESIYRAYDMMGEATKVLNKQKMQEEAEEQATEIKEKNKKKSSFAFGLNVAAAEDEDDE